MKRTSDTLMNMKRVKIVAIVITLALSILCIMLGVDYFHLCAGINNIPCEDKVRGYTMLLSPAMPVFLLSLFAYFLGNKTYKAWLIFSVMFVLFAIWILLHYDLGRNGGFGVVTSGGSDVLFLWQIYSVVAVPIVLGGYIANFLHRKK